MRLTFRRPGRAVHDALLAIVMALLCLAGAGGARAEMTELTIELDGDLLTHGGVVAVYPIPTPAAAWADMAGREGANLIRLSDRYVLVQMRYPVGGRYSYRFRPARGAPEAAEQATQVLSVIGADAEGQGPEMTAGFQGAHASGGRIIRVLSLAERAGPSEAARTAARWGEVEGRDAPPPADARSARALDALIGHGPQDLPFRCQGTDRVQQCAITAERWPAVEARWWRAIAEQRLERLRYHAQDRCRDSRWLGGACEPDPQSDEPAFRPAN